MVVLFNRKKRLLQSSKQHVQNVVNDMDDGDSDLDIHEMFMPTAADNWHSDAEGSSVERKRLKIRDSADNPLSKEQIDEMNRRRVDVSSSSSPDAGTTAAPQVTNAIRATGHIETTRC